MQQLNTFRIFAEFTVRVGKEASPKGAAALLRCISKEQKDTWRNRDIAFILIASVFLTFALSANIFPLLYVTFALTAVSAVVAFVGAYLVLSSKFNDELKYYKIYIVGAMVLPVVLYLCPMVYKVICDPSLEICLYVGITFVALITGLTVYVTSIPERLFPGRFDLCGYSHNIMHVCLIIAHVAEFMFIKACIDD